MLKTGSIILSLWSVLNLLPALYMIVHITVLGNNHPLLSTRFSEDDISAISPSLLATINGMAVYANGLVIGFCGLSLIAIWKGLNKTTMWTFWALLISSIAVVLAGFVSDYVSETNYYTASIVSALILIAGFILVTAGLFRGDRN